MQEDCRIRHHFADHTDHPDQTDVRIADHSAAQLLVLHKKNDIKVKASSKTTAVPRLGCTRREKERTRRQW